MRAHRVLPILALALAVACAGRSRPDINPRERNIMRITEIQEGMNQGITTLYELIQRNHPEWLRTLRANVTTPNTPTIWLDLQRLGGIAALQNILLTGVTHVRYLTPPEARGELGYDNPGGAIVVSSR